MKKTFRIGSHRVIISAHVAHDIHPEVVREHPVTPRKSLRERLQEADAIREQGLGFDWLPPSDLLGKVLHAMPEDADPTPEEKERERKEAERIRRANNREFNRCIAGWHFGSWVIYRAPSYPDVRSWVFRTTNREYSISWAQLRASQTATGKWGNTPHVLSDARQKRVQEGLAQWWRDFQ